VSFQNITVYQAWAPDTDCIVATYGVTDAPTLSVPECRLIAVEHVLGVGALQTHWPLAHASPEMQAAHLAPPAPQAAAVSDANGTQDPPVPPLQHPDGHVFPSQEQVPFVLSQTPFAHGAHPAPPVPQRDDPCEA
jgi:hypothetical protein